MASNRSLKDRIFGAEENSAASMDPEKLRKFQHLAARMYHTPVLSAKEIAAPAIAKLGRQMSEMIYNTYRMIFFVSILRLDMFYVTLIHTVIGVYDVLNNPLMGIAYDKTRTRWGKARPYAALAPLMYFACIAVLFCGQLFFPNDITDDPGKILFVFVMLFLQETFSTIYIIPTDNLTSLQTPNPKDRMSVGLWQTYAYKWGGDFLAGIIMALLDFSRSGWIPVSSGVIFASLGIITAMIGSGGSILMAINCRERILLQPTPAPITKTVFYLLKNKYAMRNFVTNFMGSWWSKGGYSWDVVFQLEVLGGVLRGAPFYMPRQIMQFVSLSLVERFKRLFGGSYRKTVIFMRAWDFLFTNISAFLGSRPKIIGTWWKAGLVFAAFDALCVSNDAPSTVLEAEIGREIGDYTEYVTGERPDGTIGLLTGLVGKVTAPLQAMMTMAVFRWSGYTPALTNVKWSQQNVRNNTQMYSRVFMLYNLADIVPNVLNAIPLLFYDLEGKKKAEMYLALNERRAEMAKSHVMSDEMAAMVEALASENG
ncbi:MAG: MFS transporter [Oscillospiraceae bacterium]|jgi:Na+/melibiose symporter-like transporter|nr:MFS transporter [Oscillospiraceae bacterium]